MHQAPTNKFKPIIAVLEKNPGCSPGNASVWGSCFEGEWLVFEGETLPLKCPIGNPGGVFIASEFPKKPSLQLTELMMPLVWHSLQVSNIDDVLAYHSDFLDVLPQGLYAD